MGSGILLWLRKISNSFLLSVEWEVGQRVLRRVWHTYRADHAVFLRAEPVRVNALDGVMEYYTLW